MRSISFIVYGKPEPAGSKRAFVIRGGPRAGMASVTDANPKSKNWQGDVRTEAQKAYQGEPLAVPIALVATFMILRPKGHYGSGKNATTLKPNAPKFPTSKPDATKLLRGIEDAMSSIIYVDDAQIVEQHVYKEYSERQGVRIVIDEAQEQLF